ncbi:Hypothetical predicted protein [Olea europaea subsp. europaea]|uniref:Uncharacterized protein n=1 Tax=Olea europaea subsp. europaea TaxID=158383 RepID=A0A8S0SG12_OLEEU|nr:Hypothetical predicted protein [Olea europaea subsp. europaea]
MTASAVATSGDPAVVGLAPTVMLEASSSPVMTPSTNLPLGRGPSRTPPWQGPPTYDSRSHVLGHIEPTSFGAPRPPPFSSATPNTHSQGKKTCAATLSTEPYLSQASEHGRINLLSLFFKHHNIHMTIDLLTRSPLFIWESL